jgi:hypothetical protein
MLRICDQASAECGYNPGYFRMMVLEQGGLEAARKLLRGKTHPEGLTRLWMENRLDISMEATILEERWRSLFSAEELELARQRLLALGYKVPAL